MTMRISKDKIDMDDKVLQKSVLKDYGETVVTANSSTSYTVDLTNGNVFDITMTGNCSFTFSNPPASGTAGGFTLILTQDATGSRTATWPAAVKWPSDTEPTLTTDGDGQDILSFLTVDGGTTWFGFVSGSIPGFSYDDLGESHLATGASTYDFTSYSLGSDDTQDRVVYILYASEESAARTLSSKSIDGTSATDVVATASFTNVHYGIMKATVPAGSGTTGTISFTWSSTITRMQIYGYAAYNATQEDTGSTTGTNPSFSMDVSEGGVSACMVACQNDETVTWGGDLTEQYNSSWTANSEFSIGAEEGVGTTEVNKTHSATASDAGSALFGVSFR